MLRKISLLVAAAALVLAGCASGPQTMTFKIIKIDKVEKTSNIKIWKKATATIESVAFVCDTKLVKKCADLKPGYTVTLMTVGGNVTKVGEVKKPSNKK